MTRGLVNSVGAIVRGLLALGAYEAGSPVEVRRRPSRIHGELRPRTRSEVKRPLEVQLEIRRHYRRLGWLLPHLAPVDSRPDVQVVVVDLEDGELASRRLVVDAEAGAPWDPSRKPATKVYPEPPNAAEVLAGDGTSTWPLGDGLAVRISEAEGTYRFELTRDGADPVLLHELETPQGEVPAAVLREQLAKPVIHR